MSRRILFLTQWFEPEPAFKGLKFVQALAAQGYIVEVATGFPNYPTGRLYPGYRLRPYQREVMEGIVVHRLWLAPNHDGSSLRRMTNYLSFFASALAFCLGRGRRFDLIYVYHPPITVGLAAGLAGVFTGTPFLLDVQDLWPDSVTASGMPATRSLGRLLQPVCQYVYRRAALVVGQARGMTQRLVERGVPESKAITIFNWADETNARARPDYDATWLEFTGRFNVVYGGNIGQAQGLETLVRAADLASRAEARIQLTIVGEGAEREEIADLIAKLGATDVKLRKGVPASDIGSIFAAADVLVMHLKPAPLFEVTVPSKTQFYLAVGKPVLAGVAGEAAAIIAEAKCGVVVPPGDVKAMASAMVNLARKPLASLDAMSRNARATYEKCYSFERGMIATQAAVEQAFRAAAAAEDAV